MICPVKKSIALLILVFTVCSVDASEFEELDKAPEGAHRGQIFLGAFAALGGVLGSIIDAEQKFLKFSTYTTPANSITKTIKVSHMTMGYGILFEYMPIDHLGIKTKFRRSTVIQRSMFGSQYENWSRITYSDYSWYVGPSAHVTNRKQWDVSFTPLVGYALARYTANPVGSFLIPQGYLYQILLQRSSVTMNQFLWYSGPRKKETNNISIGGEINLTAYFSGGFFLSFGFEWIMNFVKFKKPYYLQNPQNTLYFFPNGTTSKIHSCMAIISAGYAFYN